MTVRIPKAVLIGAAGLLLIATGAVLGLFLRSSSSSGGTAQLPCNQLAAKRAILDTDFATDVYSLGVTSTAAQLFQTYGLETVKCQDLTGDGNPEMVVQLSCCTAGAPFPWAIFTEHHDHWKMVLDRTDTPEPQLKVVPEGVEETTPAFGPSDPLCCAGGKREGLVYFKAGHWHYRPRLGTQDRTVTVASAPGGKPLLTGSIAGFDLSDGSAPLATTSFAIPTSTAAEKFACIQKWRDLGLRIDFYNLIAKYSCGPAGRVSSAHFEGNEAQQAGWTINGLTVGMPLATLLQRYPAARPASGRRREGLTEEGELEGSPFVLEETKAYDSRLPVLIARAVYGKVVGIDLDVGAGGE